MLNGEILLVPEIYRALLYFQEPWMTIIPRLIFLYLMHKELLLLLFKLLCSIKHGADNFKLSFVIFIYMFFWLYILTLELRFTSSVTIFIMKRAKYHKVQNILYFFLYHFPIIYCIYIDFFVFLYFELFILRY